MYFSYLHYEVSHPSLYKLSTIYDCDSLGAIWGMGMLSSCICSTLVSVCAMGGSPGDVSENPVTQEKRNKGWTMSYDVGEVMEGLENEL